METNIELEQIEALTRQGFWRNVTLDVFLDRWATSRPGKRALVDGEGVRTYAELARAVERVAYGLRAHGLGPGGVISVQLPNWNEFIVVALAANRLGALLNPIPPIYRANELRFILKMIETQIVVVPETFRGFDYVGMVAGLRAELPQLRQVFVARGMPGTGMLPFTLLTETPWETREGRGALPGTEPNEVNEIIFTSGTTGEPKGVMHTPNTTLSIIYPMIERFELTERDVILMSSTFAHQTGYLYGYCLNLLLGATGVWLDLWNAEAAARLIERERVTFTMGATPFLQDLTYTPALARHDVSSLRLFISAGASIPRQLVRDARERLRCAISAGWGMTENGLVTCNGLADREEKVVTTDGYPLRGMELRVVNEAGALSAGTEGDLLVRGHSQFAGYFKRPEFTREAHTPDGWFKTGDRAVLDRDGYVSITGRSKDVIIRGGENIGVVEVEDLLFAHPKIAGVAVVGMPDPRLQERVCAFVVPERGQSLTLGEIVEYLGSKQVAKHKYPERLEIVSEFPMTPSGKVQKYRLRQAIAQKLEAEHSS